jgi:hypothetical protein
MPNGDTGFKNVVLKKREDEVVGAGDLYAQIKAIKADLDALSAAFNAHTHRGDGAQAGAYNTSKPQSNAQTVAPVTASSVAITTK